VEKKRFLATVPGLVTAAVFCNFLWGSAIPVVRLSYQVMGIGSSEPGDLLVFAGIRFAISGAAVALLYVATEARRGANVRAFFSAQTFKDSALLGLFQTVGQYIPYYLGLAVAVGVSASLIQGSSVFITLLLSALVFRVEKLTPKKLAGCAVGFLGLVVFYAGGEIGFSLAGEGLLLLGCASGAVASVLAAILGKRTQPVLMAGLQFFLGGVVLALAGFALGGHVALSSPEAWGLLAWLSFVSAAGYSLWGVLLTLHEVSHVIVFNLLLPLFGVVLSLALLGTEGNAFGLAGVCALACVCAGIAIVQSSKG
jgi:drug/metabolite transporter (DMT)-like permease